MTPNTSNPTSSRHLPHPHQTSGHPPKTIHFDPHGDLRLLVGEKKVPFAVCSKSLARSAAVWEAMLYGPFVESARPEAGQWTVELPEDDPSALEVVLHLVHGQPQKLPEMTLELAFEVTVLADKYKMTSCLRLVARDWLEDLPKAWATDSAMCEELEEGTCYNGNGPTTAYCRMPPLEWLWITQELGDLRQYRATFSNFALETEICEATGALEIYNVWREQNEPNVHVHKLVGGDTGFSTSGKARRASFVDSVLEEIGAARLKALSMIQSSYEKDLKKLKDIVHGHHGRQKPAVFSCGAIDAAENSRVLCDMAMMGTLTAWKLGGSHCPLMPVKSQSKSPWGLQYIDDWDVSLAGEVLGDEHKRCDPRKASVPSLTALWHSAGELPEKKVEYINQQARLSGLQRRDGGSGSRKRTHDQIEDSE